MEALFQALVSIWVWGAALTAFVLFLAVIVSRDQSDRGRLSNTALIVGLAVLWPWSVIDFIHDLFAGRAQ